MDPSAWHAKTIGSTHWQMGSNWIHQLLNRIQTQIIGSADMSPEGKTFGPPKRSLAPRPESNRERQRQNIKLNCVLARRDLLFYVCLWGLSVYLSGPIFCVIRVTGIVCVRMLVVGVVPNVTQPRNTETEPAPSVSIYRLTTKYIQAEKTERKNEGRKAEKQ